MSCAHRLADAGVGTIFCLQEDSDMAYFDLDIKPIIDRCKQHGDIKHVRFPVRDFDPFSLRQRLPEAVAILVKEAASGRGKLYIHCTAGEKRLSYRISFHLHHAHPTTCHVAVVHNTDDPVLAQQLDLTHICIHVG